MKNEVEERLRCDLIAAVRQLDRAGHLPGFSGNLSARIDGDRLLMTPAGRRKGDLVESDLLVMNLRGVSRTQGEGRPSTEAAMHVCAYGADPRIRAFVHAHPESATTLGLTDASHGLQMTAEAVAILGPVTRVPYSRPGTPELAEGVGVAAARSWTLLLAMHGAATAGCSVSDAVARMEVLEHVARVHASASGMGAVPQLPEREVRELWEAFGFDPESPLGVFEA